MHTFSSVAVRENLLRLSISRKALGFSLEGITLKSGRLSPYFFGSQKLQDGECVNALEEAFGYFIHEQVKAGLQFDMMYGPTYKGIPLVQSASVGYWRTSGISVPYVYKRKEVKDHGEGGDLVGLPMAGMRVIVTDDVITVGTAVRESVDIIQKAGGTLAGLALILDRQETVIEGDPRSAVQTVSAEYNVPVFSILTFDYLISHVGRAMNIDTPTMQKMREYRVKYGVQG